MPWRTLLRRSAELAPPPLQRLHQHQRRPHPTVTPSPAAAATPTGATSDKYRRQQSPAQEDVSPVAKVNERASHVGAATLFIGPPAAADVSADDVSADDDAAAAATAAEGDDDETKRAGRKDDRQNPAPVPNRALQMSPLNTTK